MVDNFGYLTSKWGVDTEYTSRPGQRVEPITLVAENIETGEVIRRTGDFRRGGLPFLEDPRALFICYSGMAELGFLLAAGLPFPENLLDLFTEALNFTNGLWLPKTGQLAMLAYFGLEAPMDSAHKAEMRALAIRGGPYTNEQLQAIEDYCADDVTGLVRLYRHLEPRIDLPRTLIRGHYLKTLMHIQDTGMPIRRRTHTILCEHRLQIRRGLIERNDSRTALFDSWTSKFKIDRLESWLAFRGIAWPRTETGRLRLDKKTREMMADVVPELHQFMQLRSALAQMASLDKLPIGPDNRTRAHLGPFGTITGRNQPTSEFILSQPKWTRHLIAPEPGYSLANLDVDFEEIGIAAAMSGDLNLKQAYLTEPYMAFAIQSGLAPAGATKESHPQIRKICKACVLGVQYGMSADTLRFRIQKPLSYARQLSNLHRRTYPDFWRFSEETLNYALLHGSIQTEFGWNLQITPFTKSLTITNFPIQANGAEILRIACIYAVEAGVTVCAVNHDSFLIQAPTPQIAEAIEVTTEAILDAGREVLGDFELRVSSEIFHDCYRDQDGAEMWNTIWDTVAEISPALAEVAKESR